VSGKEPRLLVTFDDGTTWAIPAKIIAAERAKYFAERDVAVGDADNFHDAYLKEYEYSLGDDGELLDYCANSMNWEDVKDHAVKVSDPEPSRDYEKEWGNAHKEIER